MNDYEINMESFIKSEPEIRHLLDVACPMHISGKKKIESILIICKSISLRKYILESIKAKCGISEYKYFDIDFEMNEGDLLAKVTQAKEGEFLLCDSENLKIRDSVRKLLVRIINDAWCDIQLGKGPSAKQIRMEFPQLTYVFSCEENTPATDFLKKHCQYVIEINELKLRRLCEPCVSALLNEAHIRRSSNITDIIVRDNNNDIDKCFKSVSMIKDYMEFNSLEESELRWDMLNKIIGPIYYNTGLEYVKELRSVKNSLERLSALLEKYDDESELLKDSDMNRFMRNTWSILREIEEKLLENQDV